MARARAGDKRLQLISPPVEHKVNVSHVDFSIRDILYLEMCVTFQQGEEVCFTVVILFVSVHRAESDLLDRAYWVYRVLLWRL